MEEDKSEWQSVTTNYRAIHDAFKEDSKIASAVLGDNAVRILKLDH